MLPLIFGTCGLFQTNVFAYDKTVIFKVDKFTKVVLVMWYSCRKYCHTWISTYSVECVFIESDNPLQCVIFQNTALDILFFFALARNRRLRYDNYGSCTLCQ